jgi:hypothetical protein
VGIVIKEGLNKEEDAEKNTTLAKYTNPSIKKI